MWRRDTRSLPKTFRQLRTTTKNDLRSEWRSTTLLIRLVLLLVAIDIFYLIYGGDAVYTPLTGLIGYIEEIALGMTLYLVTFSSIKDSFKWKNYYYSYY